MKICIINSLFPPYGRGGAEVVAERVALGLRDAGHEVVIISSMPWKGWKSLRPQKTLENGMTIYRYFPLNVSSFLYLGQKSLPVRLLWHIIDICNIHTYIAVKHILKEERPNAVLTHNLKGLGYTIPTAIRNIKIKHIHTLHDVQLVEPSGLLTPSTNNESDTNIRMLYGKICRWLFGSPDVVLSPSKWLLDFYAKRDFFQHSQKVILPNPIEKININRKLPTPNSQLNLLFLGQLETHKGIIFLIQTLKEFKESFHLTIAGLGSKISNIEAMVKDDHRFEMTGETKGEALNEIWTKTDCTIIPSLVYENAPLVISESLVHGVPVLASKIGGIPEMVEEGKTGFLFEPGNKAEFVFNLQKVSEIKKVGALAALQAHAIESMKDKTIDHYINVLENNI